MSIATASHSRSAARRWFLPSGFRDALAIAAIIGIVAGMQIASGSYHRDFAADADEAGHAVSSLLVRDYIAAGAPRHARQFAQEYYVHYPKVAIGHWPPLLYAAEGAWMLAFGRSRGAMLALITLADLLLLISVYLWVRRDCGALAGFLSAAALAAPVFMQVSISSVGPNIFLALLAFWAAAAFGEYLETKRWPAAIWFAIAALAAIGIHGRGVAVILIPVIAPLVLPAVRRRTWLWRSLALLAAILVLILGPRGMSQTYHPSIAATFVNAAGFLSNVFTWMGWPVAILAAIGSITAVRVLPVRWRAMLGLIFSCWLFHSVVNLPFEDRFLATSAPAIAIMFGAGIHFVTDRWRAAGTIIVLIACAGLVRTAVPLWREPDPGFHRMPAGMTPPGDPGTYLVAGEAIAEGAFIAEMDLRDPKPDHIALRASKMLARSGWNEFGYHMLYSNPQEVSQRLDELHVTLVLIAAPLARPHLGQLLETVTGNPAVWTELPSDFPSVRVFRRIGPLPPGSVKIRVPVNDEDYEAIH